MKRWRCGKIKTTSPPFYFLRNPIKMTKETEKIVKMTRELKELLAHISIMAGGMILIASVASALLFKANAVIITSPSIMPASSVIVNIESMRETEKDAIDEAEPVIKEAALAEPIVEADVPIEEVLPPNFTDITSPSNLSAEQLNDMIESAVTANGYTDSIFINTGEYLYDAEREYGINAIYILAVGTWEGEWGTSWAAKNKFNSYGIYGSSSLRRYGSVEEGINDFSRLMAENYFPWRTTPSAIGSKYCPPNANRWAQKINLIMNIYSKYV